MVKRRVLLRELKRFAKEEGLKFEESEGAKHTKITIGTKQSVIPRHSEINDYTADSIRKQLGK